MLRYNICSAWFLDIRISTCFLGNFYSVIQPPVRREGEKKLHLHKIYRPIGT